jgi:hypothetical protein
MVRQHHYKYERCVLCQTLLTGKPSSSEDGTGQYHSRWSFRRLSGARLSGFFQDMQPVPGRGELKDADLALPVRKARRLAVLTNQLPVPLYCMMQQCAANHLSLLPPHAATCRLGWYTAQPPRYTGNTVLCSGSSKENCLEPCHAGYDQLQDSSLCMQRCPDEASGPAHLCPISRTCIRAAGVCSMHSNEIPYICPVPDQFLGE